MTAEDPTGIASSSVTIDGEGAPADMDGTSGRYQVTGFDPNGLADGPHELVATASDNRDNEGTQAITVFVNLMGAGSISGIVFKGPVDGAQVTAYRWAGGVTGAALGSATTLPSGVYFVPIKELIELLVRLREDSGHPLFAALNDATQFDWNGLVEWPVFKAIAGAIAAELRRRAGQE